MFFVFITLMHFSLILVQSFTMTQVAATSLSLENILENILLATGQIERLCRPKKKTTWKIFFGSDEGGRGVEGRANYARRLLMAWLCASSCTEERGRAEGGDAEQGRLTDASRHILPCAEKRAPIVPGLFPPAPRHLTCRQQSHV